jgi:uncharacterized protein (TIGR02996 family)
MSDGDALFRAVCEQPWEDTPRLVYADWLEENGRPERAEFIRIRCEPWTFHPTIAETLHRLHELERRHGAAWRAELPAVEGVVWGATFVRGFIDAVQVSAGDERLFDRLDAVFRAAPVARLTLEPLAAELLPRLFESPWLARVTVLRLPRVALDAHAYLAAAGRRLPHLALVY